MESFNFPRFDLLFSTPLIREIVKESPKRVSLLPILPRPSRKRSAKSNPIAAAAAAENKKVRKRRRKNLECQGEKESTMPQFTYSYETGGFLFIPPRSNAVKGPTHSWTLFQEVMGEVVEEDENSPAVKLDIAAISKAFKTLSSATLYDDSELVAAGVPFSCKDLSQMPKKSFFETFKDKNESIKKLVKNIRKRQKQRDNSKRYRTRKKNNEIKNSPQPIPPSSKYTALEGEK